MLKKVIGLLAALSVSACATPYVATPYDRAASNVDTIALVDDSLAPKAIAYEVASTGGNFGLIGALVDAGIQESRKNAVNEALETVQFDAEAVLESRIIATLGSDGYTVLPLAGTDREERDLLDNYPPAPGETDAYLDVSVTDYGYLSAGAGQPFRPTVYAKVRLVRATDGVKLMDNMILLNPVYPTDGVITLSPNPEYAFNNRGELLADPVKLAAGITDALNRVAEAAAQLLR